MDAAFRWRSPGFSDRAHRDEWLFRQISLRLDQPVGNLSVGGRRKLQLARLIGRRANLLLLDEPTNHLSLDVVEAFEEALLQFTGPILAASHDRRFIERIGSEVWELRDGRLLR